jgi:hypothetical protein
MCWRWPVASTQRRLEGDTVAHDSMNRTTESMCVE